jgi:hypothetical protein
VICAIAILKAYAVQGACVWEETFGLKQYYLYCGGSGELDANLPEIPSDALGATLDGVKGIVPQNIFSNRTLSVV